MALPLLLARKVSHSRCPAPRSTLPRSASAPLPSAVRASSGRPTRRTPSRGSAAARKAVGEGYGRATGLAAEVVGTSVLVYTVFSVTVAKRNARGSAKVDVFCRLHRVYIYRERRTVASTDGRLAVAGPGFPADRFCGVRGAPGHNRHQQVSFGAAVVYNQAMA